MAGQRSVLHAHCLKHCQTPTRTHARTHGTFARARTHVHTHARTSITFLLPTHRGQRLKENPNPALAGNGANDHFGQNSLVVSHQNTKSLASTGTHACTCTQKSILHSIKKPPHRNGEACQKKKECLEKASTFLQNTQSPL